MNEYRATYETLAARNMGYIREKKVQRLYHHDEDVPDGVWHILTALYTYPQAAELLGSLGYQSFDTCLDIGCGTVRFADFFPVNRNYLFDIAFLYCKYMQAVNADIESMPIPDAAADLVVCSDILEHVLHFDVALQEIRRILKRGGILLASVPHDAPVNEMHLRTFHKDSLDFPGFDILGTRITKQYKAWLQDLVIVLRRR